MEIDSHPRIEFLDGFRGLAILLVVLFHALARWPLLVPYGSSFSDFFLAKYGWLGVELFFMLSGFVIYMTLEKCRSFSDFLQRRWLRLFPAMLLVSTLVYLTSGLLPERPAGSPALADTLPGLLFIDPKWISLVFHVNQGVLEGAFWSLFVEVKFYVFFGGLYFLFKSRIARAGLLLVSLASLLATVSTKFLGPTFALGDLLDTILNRYLSLNYFGWFLVGVLTYDLFRYRSPSKLVLTLMVGGLVAGWVSFAHMSDFLATGLFAFSLVLLFVGSIYSVHLRQVISTKFLLFFGFISYPFYLFHENFMVATIIKLGNSAPQIPGILLPLVPLLSACVLAYLIAKYIEPAMRKRLKTILQAGKNLFVHGTKSHR